MFSSVEGGEHTKSSGSNNNNDDDDGDGERGYVRLCTWSDGSHNDANRGGVALAY